MIAREPNGNRSSAPLAAVLLVIQSIAGGVVPLAHASERFTAPAHVEAQHATGCLALHDELRCVLCHFAGTQVLAQPVRLQPAARTGPERRFDQPEFTGTHGPDHLPAPPRAPPASLV